MRGYYQHRDFHVPGEPSRRSTWNTGYPRKGSGIEAGLLPDSAPTVRAHAEITAESVRNDPWSCATDVADHVEDVKEATHQGLAVASLMWRRCLMSLFAGC